MELLFKILLAPLIFALSIAGYSTPVQTQTFGADTVLPAGLQTYTLSGSGISSSATSITLSSFTNPQSGYEILDSNLSDTFYLTIEPGNRTKQEIVSCSTVTQSVTNTTATLSGCVRGLAPISPYTASTTLQFPHGGNSSVVFSNPPQFYNQYAALANDETITGDWFVPIPANPLSVVNKAYSDALANAGAATSTETNGGIVELATQQEMASSTPHDAAKPRVLYAEYSTSSPWTAGMYVPVTDKDGKLNNIFWRLSDAFNFTGTTRIKNLNASSTAANPMVLNGVSLDIPSTQGASTTALMNDGSGHLTWNPIPVQILYHNPSVNNSTTANATTTLLTVPIPANTLGTSNKSLRITGWWQGTIQGNAACYADIEFGNGSATTTIGYIGDGSFQGFIELGTELTATSTATQYSFSKGLFSTTGLSLAQQAISVKGISSNYDLTAITYLGFAARSVNGSDRCPFTGAMVELITK